MSYNNGVLVGNWSEERLKNEYEFKIFLRKRKRRELLLQRSRNLFSNLLKEQSTPIRPSSKHTTTVQHALVCCSSVTGSMLSSWLGRPLAISGTFVLFGFNVQLVASDMLAKPKCEGSKPQYGLALSSLVTARQVDYMQNINDGCLMTLSPITTPCCRNTFVILSTEDESLSGTKMNYGDEFFLRAENYGDPDAPPLYVRYTPEGAPSPANRMPIRLSSTKDTNCRWSTIPLLPRDRLEGQGSAVKIWKMVIVSLERKLTGAKLIVKNCVADKNLCVMNQQWMQTFFGAECGVTVRNVIDIHKRFTAENIFTLVSDVETKSKD